jgi:hypothetical protein
MRQDPDPNQISSQDRDRDGIPLFNSDNPSRARAGFGPVGIGTGIRDKNRDWDSSAGPYYAYYLEKQIFIEYLFYSTIASYKK